MCPSPRLVMAARLARLLRRLPAAHAVGLVRPLLLPARPG